MFARCGACVVDEAYQGASVCGRGIVVDEMRVRHERVGKLRTEVERVRGGFVAQGRVAGRKDGLTWNVALVEMGGDEHVTQDLILIVLAFAIAHHGTQSRSWSVRTLASACFWSTYISIGPSIIWSFEVFCYGRRRCRPVR